jgi:hypothetical protein
MIHSNFGMLSLFLWIFGTSTVLLAAFLTVEFVQHRRTYLSDGWSEEALLEDGIAAGTLPRMKHIVAMELTKTEQANANTQQTPTPRESLAHTIPMVHTAAR